MTRPILTRLTEAVEDFKERRGHIPKLMRLSPGDVDAIRASLTRDGIVSLGTFLGVAITTDMEMPDGVLRLE